MTHVTMPDGFKGLGIWVTSPPTVKPQVSLTNLKYFFTSLALGLPKQLWSGYFIAVLLINGLETHETRMHSALNSSMPRRL